MSHYALYEHRCVQIVQTLGATGDILEGGGGIVRASIYQGIGAFCPRKNQG